MKKAIVYGVRGEGINCYLVFEKKYDIIAFADEDDVFYKKELFGKRVIKPDDILLENFDIILISSRYWFDTLKMQFLDMGIPEYKISDEYFSQYRDVNGRWEFERERLCGIITELGVKYCQDKYEMKWQKLKKRQGKIKVYMLFERYLGEFLVRIAAIQKYEKDDGIYKVFLPCYFDTSFVCNYELIKALAEQINLIYGIDLLFWQYVLKNKYEELDLSDITKYMLRDAWKCIKLQLGESLIHLKEDRLAKARERISEWGLDSREYVCFGARTGKYLIRSAGSDYGFEFRNSDFPNYQLSIDYLSDRGIKSVKMGRNEDIDSEIKNCVDYAGFYANDYMDLVLFSLCKFAVVTVTGMWQLPSSFGKPVVVVNAVSFTMGCGGIPFTEYDIYIPKKYIYKSSGKYLSLKEIIKVDRMCKNNGDMLDKNGIVFIDNTPREILDTIKEFLLRLQGEWEDEEIDKEYYKRYQEIMRPLEVEGFEHQVYHSSIEYQNPMSQVVEDMSYCFSAWRNRKGNEGGPIPCRISATYLRNNPYLLD